ncbi:MAG: hypothetical protein A3K10_02640 [Bacteroidetes bacterium RIFCSPLOWO2_12_FULL_31_6]|nr:MAG: hypothetical protein A3K10_02640 [Bacteroidetes bacterium RIFCSPLOWO2_12_FULL_31_6]
MDKLNEITNLFFQKHWNISSENHPKWSEEWSFNGTIPNHDRQGCYALIKGGEIIYIGVGIGNGDGNYVGCGLGNRLKRYWKVNKNTNSESKRSYTQKEKWEEVDSIKTIGFHPEYFYLAAALEIFLIDKLNPIRNKSFNK